MQHGFHNVYFLKRVLRKKSFRLLQVLICLHAVLSVFSKTAFAQLESETGSILNRGIEKWYEIRIDSQIINTFISLKQPKNVSYQFAIPVPVNLNPGNSGTLYHIDNEMIWIIGIRSKGARSLGIILKPFKVPDGGYVYEYDSALNTIMGAFTSQNNYSSGILPTMPVPGEELILEYHFPDKTRWENTIGIIQVSHDFLGVFGKNESKDSRYGLSQSCNIDINCAEGIPFATEKRAVCRLIINGTELCSGVLLNNTNQENRALLISAQHCIANQNDADKTIFVFGYESPWCSGPDGRVYHSISGSVLRSSNADVDFTVVELNTFPPYVYKPYLAGWDISGNTPANSVAIHHPLGDVKKISVDYNSPVSAAFNSMPANSSWKILQWDLGTTEGGSSGSPLFDQNKKIVGILTGGEAVCGRSVNDYFAKLSVCYNYSSAIYMQLKGWIDPAVSGVKSLAGRDPYASNAQTTDTLYNLTKTEANSISANTYTSPKTGYSTGFNSDSLTMYAEYFSNSLTREISEVWLNIAKANYAKIADSVKIYVFGDGSSPGTILASQKALISESRDSFLLKYDFGKTVQVTGNFYIGWKLFYGNNAVSETRQFALFHSPDRILPSKNTAWFNDGKGWKIFPQHPYAPMSVSLDVKVITVTNSKPDNIEGIKASTMSFTVYPVPASDRLVISSRTKFDNIGLSFYNDAGRLVSFKQVEGSMPGEIPVDIGSVKPGFYLLKITSGSYSETHKILINR